MRIRLPLLVSAAVVAVLLLAACETSAIDSLTFESPLSRFSPIPTAIPYTLEAPALAEGTGAVHGRLVAGSESARIFMAGQVYLAPFRQSEGEVSIPYVSVDTSADPLEDMRTPEGEFMVLDVPPGEYGLVVYTPLTSYLAPGDNNGLMIIEVVAGEIYDVGQIVIP